MSAGHLIEVVWSGLSDSDRFKLLTSPRSAFITILTIKHNSLTAYFFNILFFYLQIFPSFIGPFFYFYISRLPCLLFARVAFVFADLLVLDALQYVLHPG